MALDNTRTNILVSSVEVRIVLAYAQVLKSANLFVAYSCLRTTNPQTFRDDVQH